MAKQKKRDKRAERLIVEARSIFRGWFSNCSDAEIRDSFAEWRTWTNKATKYLAERNN